MAAFSFIPKVIRVKKPEEVPKAILKVQIKEGGKVSIISITQDALSKDWIVFYYPFGREGGVL